MLSHGYDATWFDAARLIVGCKYLWAFDLPFNIKCYQMLQYVSETMLSCTTIFLHNRSDLDWTVELGFTLTGPQSFNYVNVYSTYTYPFLAVVLNLVNGIPFYCCLDELTSIFYSFYFKFTVQPLFAESLFYRMCRVRIELTQPSR